MIPILPLGLDSALASVGWTWQQIQAEASEIILFGSQAAETQSANSDWDVLCIGTGHRQKSPLMDLIWVSQERVESAAWLETELAGHIAKYGKCLCGAFTWQELVCPSDRATSKKSKRVSSRINTLYTVWHKLAPVFRTKHLRLTTADVLRMSLLSQFLQVPPTSRLTCGNLDDLCAITREQLSLGWMSSISRDHFLSLHELQTS